MTAAPGNLQTCAMDTFETADNSRRGGGMGSGSAVLTWPGLLASAVERSNGEEQLFLVLGSALAARQGRHPLSPWVPALPLRLAQSASFFSEPSTYQRHTAITMPKAR